MRLAYATIAACSLLVGCQTVAQPMVSKFSPDEADYIRESGSGSIVGQAFARQVGGGVVTAAGSPVILMPDQYYTRELANRLSSGSALPTDADPIAGYGKTTTADASGSFRFTGLAQGDYVVLTAVEWGVPTQYGVERQGGGVYQAVSVQSGSTTEVILNR